MLNFSQIINQVGNLATALKAFFFLKNKQCWTSTSNCHMLHGAASVHVCARLRYGEVCARAVPEGRPMKQHPFHRLAARVWSTGMNHGYKPRAWNTDTTCGYETQVWRNCYGTLLWTTSHVAVFVPHVWHAMCFRAVKNRQIRINLSCSRKCSPRRPLPTKVPTAGHSNMH